ncbi:hypothetical protein GJ496_003044 [Pomphorhynchus laevis]|nr:hypothetical protein GJ496_003044 [Pomphorhynchus laevis]
MNFRRDIWSSLDVHQRNQSQIMYHQIQSADGIHTANIPNNSLLSNGSGSLSETSNQENDDDLDMNVDGEGVWSPDIELCFQEALSLYPPCGRRKIILSEEGKMYGRNELIAKYIKEKTGKIRTRKQVSSHIQVLAKRRAKEYQTICRENNMLEQNFIGLSSAQIVSMDSKMDVMMNSSQDALYYSNENSTDMLIHDWSPQCKQPPAEECSAPYGLMASPYTLSSCICTSTSPTDSNPMWTTSNQIGSGSFRLTEFSVFVTKIPEENEFNRQFIMQLNDSTIYSLVQFETIRLNQLWDSINCFSELSECFTADCDAPIFVIKLTVDPSNFIESITNEIVFGSKSVFESLLDYGALTCSTKLCSFGKCVLEKVDDEYAMSEAAKWIYYFENIPICEYLTHFILKLIALQHTYLMNSVLEDFSIFKSIRVKATNQLLLGIGFTFEVADGFVPTGINSLTNSPSKVYRVIR